MLVHRTHPQGDWLQERIHPHQNLFRVHVLVDLAGLAQIKQLIDPLVVLEVFALNDVAHEVRRELLAVHHPPLIHHRAPAQPEEEVPREPNRLLKLNGS